LYNAAFCQKKHNIISHMVLFTVITVNLSKKTQYSIT